MVFGCFSTRSSINEDLLDLFPKTFNQECHYFERITLKNFSSRIGYHRSLPYSIKDFVYVNEEGTLLIILDGNIFNQKAICKQFGWDAEIKDPELVGKIFNCRGVDFINLLNGDFLITIYQIKEDILYLFRDHVGIRSVGYCLKKDSCFISTDLFRLSSALHEDPTIDLESFLDGLKFIDYTRAPNKRVKKLMPGHFLIFDGHNVVIKRYWEPGKIKSDLTLTFNQIKTDLSHLLSDAIQIRCDSRFRAAAHVSGGLDSGFVASLSRKEYQGIFYGYSWSTENFKPVGVEFDERELVRKTCRMNDITSVFIKSEYADDLNYSKDFIKNFGYFEEIKVLEHAASEGVNLIYSGWGGDEFISKGERGINSDLLFQFRLRSFLSRNPLKATKSFFKTLLYDVFFPAMHIINPAQLRILKDLKYVKKSFKKNHYPSLKRIWFYRSRRQLHLNFLWNYHLQARMEQWAVAGTHYGVEYRYPLLDKRIIEYVLKIPSHLMYRDNYTRIWLRELSKGILPEEVRWRTSGVDPVCFANADQRSRELRSSILAEMIQFRNNPDIAFFEFDLIEKDIIRHNGNADEMLKMDKLLLLIKMLHEFTIAYRKTNFVSNDHLQKKR